MKDTAHPLDLQLLERCQSYDEIAQALGTERASARQAVVEAVEQSVASNRALAPSEALRAEIIDYLLGEQTSLRRERTRAALDRSATARAWANEVRLSLTLVMRTSLPPIPDPATELVPGRADGPGWGRVQPPSLQFEGAHVGARGGVVDRRIYVRRRATALLVLVLAAAGVIVAVLSLLSPSRSAPGVTTLRATLQRLHLTPTAAQPQASALAAVLRSRSNRLLLVQGRGLAPNHGDYYAVWLYNAPGDAELLGLINPAVGGAGTFASDTPLPRDAARFHTLLVTHESGPGPQRPGQSVLSSPLAVR